MLAKGNKKHCPSCGKIKSINDFGPSRNRKDGLRVYCYECRRIKSKERYYADVDKTRLSARKRTRKYRKRHPEILDKERRNAREWYHKNKHKAISNRREWRKTSSGRKSVIKMNQERRSRHKNSIVDLSFDDIDFLLILQNNECAKCGNEFGNNNKNRYTLDHIVPLSLGGNLILENTQLLCRSCNSSKHDRIIMYRPNINFECLTFI